MSSAGLTVVFISVKNYKAYGLCQRGYRHSAGQFDPVMNVLQCLRTANFIR